MVSIIDINYIFDLSELEKEKGKIDLLETK